MNERTIKALVEAGAVKKVRIIANGAAIHIDIVTKNGAVTATTLKGAVKVWAAIDTAAKWIKNLGIGRIELIVEKWLPDQKGLKI